MSHMVLRIKQYLFPEDGMGRCLQWVACQSSRSRTHANFSVRRLLSERSHIVPRTVT